MSCIGFFLVDYAERAIRALIDVFWALEDCLSRLPFGDGFAFFSPWWLPPSLSLRSVHLSP